MLDNTDTEARLRQVIGIGDMSIGRGSGELVTHALGSCLGLVFYDPELRLGCLLHAMLPLAKLNPQKAAANPMMFVDTGVVACLEAMFGGGCKKARLLIKAAGCAGPLATGNLFRIGERNFEILDRVLAKNRLPLLAQDVGGTKSRTMRMDLDTGEVTLTSGPRSWIL